MPSSVSGSAAFSVALSTGIRLKNWKTKPNRRRRSLVSSSSVMPATSRPSISMEPLVGVSSPPSRFSSVDLPQPLGPMTATNSPGSTVRSTSSSAVTAVLPDP